MIDRNKMIFFNTAYMQRYQGHWDTDIPVNGGTFIADYGWGGEVFNFQPYKEVVYGYVEPGLVKKGGRQRKIDISRLIRPGGIKNVPHISGVLVIWVARPPKSDESVMVGWYEDATVHRACQKFLQDPQRILPNGSYDYFATAKESDCHLLPQGNRTLTIPRGASAFGHSNIWYAQTDIGEITKGSALRFIQNWKNSHPT